MTTKKQVNGLIDQLKGFIKTIDTAAVIVPLIKEYMEVAVKSDEHLVRMADIVQRMLRAERQTDSSGQGIITEEEKAQLLDELDSEQERLNEEEERKQKVDEKMQKVQEDIDKAFIPKKAE